MRARVLRRVPVLTGRRRELELVDAALQARPGATSMLVFRGDSGIGKTALIDAAQQRGLDTGHRVLRTFGAEVEARTPFAGLHQLIAGMTAEVAHLRPEQREAIHASFGLSAARPELFLIAEGVHDTIKDASASQPVLLLVDDVQWLDEQTQDVLSYLSRRLSRAQVVVVAGLRPGYGRNPFGSATVVDLEPLGESDAEQLLAEQAPDLPAGQRRQVLAAAAGNPLALIELPRVRDLRHIAADVPTLSTRLEHAFASRLPELSRAQRDVVLIAAVDPSDDVDEVLQAASRLAGCRVEMTDLAAVCDVGLMSVHDGRLRFRHPLVRSGVLQAETLSRRQAAHAALARVVSDPFRRSWHRAHAIVGPDDDVARELENAASVALDRGAVTAASDSLERAAHLTSQLGLRGHRLLRAAELAFDAGRAGRVAELVRAARRTELSELDDARLQWLQEIFNDGIPGDAARVAELCTVSARAAAAGDRDLALNLLLGAALRCWWADTGPAARAAVVAAARSLPATWRPDARFTAILAVAEPVLEAGSVSRSLLAADSRTADADGADLRLLGMAAHAIGDSPRAARLLHLAADSLRQQGRMGLLAHVLSMAIVVRLEIGDLDGAIAAVEEGLHLAQDTGQPIWTTGTLVCAARAEAMLGRTSRARELAARAELASSRQRLNDLLACVEMARGLAELADGDDERAYAAFARMFDHDSPAFHQRERFDGVMYYAETAARTGRLASARAVLAEMDALAAVTPSPLLHAHLLVARAALAEDTVAEGVFAEALRADLSQWPWVRARLHIAHAYFLWRHSRPREADRALAQAQELYAATGATEWARRIDARRKARS